MTEFLTILIIALILSSFNWFLLLRESDTLEIENKTGASPEMMEIFRRIGGRR